MFSLQFKRALLVRIAMVLALALPTLSHATIVRMQTNLGAIDITLYDAAAPRTVANFLAYVNSGAYRNSFVHRSDPGSVRPGVAGFVIQGGGYIWSDLLSDAVAIATNAPVANEFSATRLNKRGTIAMARVGGSPNSATSQWFINLVDNGFLDGVDGGFTVFGEVSASSMAVVDAIAALPITNAGPAFSQLPIVGTITNTIQKSNLVLSTNVIAVPNNYQGMWWAGESESGWGMNLTQHGNQIFAAMYTYDDAGQPIWYVIPNCPVTTNSCVGDIFRVNGGTSPAVAWSEANKVVTKVGSSTLTFASTTAGTFAFTINNVSGTKAIMPQNFAVGVNPPAIDYSDMWWNANESGWGLSITQQFSIIFAAWYTYDATGKPIWYVVPNCPVIGTGCSGLLYQVTGGEALTAVWNGTNPAVSVGSVTLAFSNATTGTMNYTLNGVTANRAITRQPF